MPTLWALGALLVGGILVLVVLTLTHMESSPERSEAPVTPSVVVPAKPAAPPPACFPLAPC
ncbi:hypothetical protein [Nocardia rhamnosiphila]